MEDWIVQRLLLWIPLVLSLAVHEWAHAFTAFQLGDDTARMQGRMTVDPFAHIDPVGTIALPLIGVPFGWAKPVPVEPARFDASISMSWGMLLTAIAGPVSNALLALFAFASLTLGEAAAPAWIAEGTAVRQLLDTLLVINLALALFNLLPIHPLDGSRVVDWLVPGRLRGAWHAFSQISPWVLLAGVVALTASVGLSQLGASLP